MTWWPDLTRLKRNRPPLGYKGNRGQKTRLIRPTIHRIRGSAASLTRIALLFAVLKMMSLCIWGYRLTCPGRRGGARKRTRMDRTCTDRRGAPLIRSLRLRQVLAVTSAGKEQSRESQHPRRSGTHSVDLTTKTVETTGTQSSGSTGHCASALLTPSFDAPSASLSSSSGDGNRKLPATRRLRLCLSTQTHE